VQLLAGHRSIQTTQRYIDGDSAKIDIQEKLDFLLRKAAFGSKETAEEGLRVDAANATTSSARSSSLSERISTRSPLRATQPPNTLLLPTLLRFTRETRR
jgi:hypothetical protein